MFPIFLFRGAKQAHPNFAVGQISAKDRSPLKCVESTTSVPLISIA
ncbi:MAG: hypothetical protein HY538_06285 [Deltaproteobacteria bacterium]|nr:hypothetical protein [Deltaproteobacteria bacterium]